MLYEITKECRINNETYKVGDVVDPKKIGDIYSSVMKPTEKTSEKKEDKKTEKKDTPKKENKIEKTSEKKEK